MNLFSLGLTSKRKQKQLWTVPHAYIGFNQKKNRHFANSAEEAHAKIVSTKLGCFPIHLKMKMANSLSAVKYAAYVIDNL